MFTVAVWLFPALRAICVALPAVPVAVKFTGLPVSPPDVAWRLLAPGVVPRVQLVTCAIPAALVATIAGDAAPVLPPPLVTVNVTDTPATGLLN